MVRDFFSRVAKLISDFVHQPVKVLSLCLLLVFGGLILDGTLFRLWALHRDSRELTSKTKSLIKEQEQLEMQISRAEDPKFIELQARERFDLASEGDLIFVFADEAEADSEAE